MIDLELLIISQILALGQIFGLKQTFLSDPEAVPLSESALGWVCKFPFLELDNGVGPSLTLMLCFGV